MSQASAENTETLEAAPIRVLQIEDNRADAVLARELIEEASPGKFELKQVERLDDAIALLNATDEETFQVVLLDLGLPDSQGLASLEKILEVAYGVPVVVLTGQSDQQLGREAVKLGAEDYLEKQQISAKYLLARTLDYAIHRNARRSAAKSLRAEHAFVLIDDSAQYAIDLSGRNQGTERSEVPLRQTSSKDFDSAVGAYCWMLEGVLETTASSSGRKLGIGSRADRVVEMLTIYNARPSDLVDVHTDAVRRLSTQVDDHALTVIQRAGQELLLTMMGRLAATYRRRK